LAPAGGAVPVLPGRGKGQGFQSGGPRRDGQVEAIRALMVTKRTARGDTA
jgi:hypothetical protein